MPKKTADYTSLNAELNEVLAALQAPDVQVDQAVVLYEKGLKLIDQLEAHLQQAEHAIRQLKLQYPEEK